MSIANKKISLFLLLLTLVLSLLACTRDEPKDFDNVIKGKKGIKVELLFDIDYYVRENLKNLRRDIRTIFRKKNIRNKGSSLVQNKLIFRFSSDKHLFNGKKILYDSLSKNYNIKEKGIEKYYTFSIEPKLRYRKELVEKVYHRFMLIMKKRMLLLSISQFHAERDGERANIFVQFDRPKNIKIILHYLKLFQDLHLADALKKEQCDELKCFPYPKLIQGTQGQSYVYKAPMMSIKYSIENIKFYQSQQGKQCLRVVFNRGNFKSFDGPQIKNLAWIIKTTKMIETSESNQYKFMTNSRVVDFDTYHHPTFHYKLKACRIVKSIAKDLWIEYKYGSYFTPVGIISYKQY